jgi:hypothetical protein
LSPTCAISKRDRSLAAQTELEPGELRRAAVLGTIRRMAIYDQIPDVRDGLTREERVVLYVLHETQKERGGRNVPTAMLWGRVCEHFYISPDDLSAMLARLGARRS